MKTKYLYVKNGKIELTPTELEEIMKEKYNEGYEAAKILYNTSCSNKISWWDCPYKYNSGCPVGSINTVTTGSSPQTTTQPIDITYSTGTADANTAITSKADYTYTITSTSEDAVNAAITMKG